MTRQWLSVWGQGRSGDAVLERCLSVRFSWLIFWNCCIEKIMMSRETTHLVCTPGCTDIPFTEIRNYERDLAIGNDKCNAFWQMCRYFWTSKWRCPRGNLELRGEESRKLGNMGLLQVWFYPPKGMLNPNPSAPRSSQYLEGASWQTWLEAMLEWVTS